jgi:quinol---cytochrome c reductase iron-sulfur subunit, bacillus type
MDISTRDPQRRQFFARVIKTIQTAIGGTLGVVLGGSIVSPSLLRREARWLPAASLSGLADNAPTPIALRVVREDGYSQIIDRRVVFLVKTGESSVMALDPTCTHLGCRVSWDADTRELKCPCHGGVYDHLGQVKSGPPPAALPRLSTRVDGDKIFIQV